MRKKKNKGLVFHGMAQAIWLINSLLDGEHENIPNIHGEFADYLAFFSQEISPKSFSISQSNCEKAGQGQ